MLLDSSLKEEACDQSDEFIRLFSSYSRRIRTYIRTLIIDPTDTEEIFQNTSCVLWRKFNSFDKSTNFMHWACRVAYLEVCNYRRIKKRGFAFSGHAFGLIATEAEKISTESLENRDWRLAALRECLKKVNDRESELLRLTYEEHCKPKEIANRKGEGVHKIYRQLGLVHDSLLRCINSQRKFLEGS